MMAAGTRSSAKLVIDGKMAKTIAWMMNMLKKVKGRPMPSESQPQNKRPAPLKMPITLTSSAAVTAPTPVNFCANGEATEISAAPAGKFYANNSHRGHHHGRGDTSGNVQTRLRPAVWRRTHCGPTV